MPGEDTAEYRIVVSCCDRIKTAVQMNIGRIADIAVSKFLITPDNGEELRNSYHTSSDSASKFVQMVQSKVQGNERYYQIFVDVLGENCFLS